MSPGHLKLRSDLVVSRQDTSAGTAFVVKDPATGRFFRLREADYFVARQLDGETPLDAIRRRAEERFGVPLAQDTLEQFIEGLGRLGLLEAEGAESERPAHRRGRVRGSFLYLRLRAFDPDRLLDRLVRRVRFVFTPHSLALSAALILLALAMALSNGGEIARDFQRLYRLQALLLAYLTLLLIGVAHEFAHGLTCKYFGGEVHEIGFLLLYFQPALYCNVSDAWLFPERSKRLWVTFAGAYFEVFAWALAVVIWRVTAPGTVLNYAALVGMAASGIKVLFNFNPLIKLDGYYLLSDYLEIPNLRQRAFRYVGAGIKRLWGPAVQRREEMTPRERRVYLIYGLLAGAYSFSLLGFIALQFGGFLTGRYQGFGFVLFTVFLAGVFRNPLKKALSRPPGLFRPEQRAFISMKWPTKALAVLAALLVLFFGRMELKVSGEFEVFPAHNADVRARVEGIIEEVYANEGDAVNAGDPIARLSEREEIELTRREVETAKTRLEYVRKGYEEAGRMRAERLFRAEIAVEKAKERLKYAKNSLDRFRTLFEKALVPRQQFERAEEETALREKELEEAQAELQMVLVDDLAEARKAVAIAQKEVEEAEGRLRVLLMGNRPEAVEAAGVEISPIETPRRYLTEHHPLVKVVSPISGVVTTPKLKEKIGQYVRRGDLIAQVYDLKTVRAEIPVSESEIADVQVGQRIILKSRAYPQKSFYGRVTSIAPVATHDERRGEKTILVTTQVDNPSLLLKPEMTGNAKVFCGKRRIVDLITRRFVRFIRVEFWSWW